LTAERAATEATQHRLGLPEDWTAVILDSNVVEVQSGFACALKHAVEEGVAHLRPFNIGNDGKLRLEKIINIPADLREDYGKFDLEAGDILFNNTNSVELVGKAAIVREPMNCAFSNHISRLRVRNAERLAPAWLALCLRVFWMQGYFRRACNKWIGQAGFAPKRLAEVAIPLTEIEIQHRIVARVEELLAQVKEARALLGEMRRDAERMMDASLAETLIALDAEFSESPSVGDLIAEGYIKVSGGGTPSKSNSEYWTGSIPWVSPKDMKRWRIGDTIDHVSPIALKETSAKLIPPGSVLVVTRGMILAHTWPVAVTTAEVAINQDMKALLPRSGLLSEYLAYVLRARAPEVLQQVETAAHGTRRLTTSTLTAMPVPLPDTVAQEQIVAHLDAVQAEVDRMRETLDEEERLLDRLERSVLERVFRGEL